MTALTLAPPVSPVPVEETTRMAELRRELLGRWTVEDRPLTRDERDDLIADYGLEF